MKIFWRHLTSHRPKPKARVIAFFGLFGAGNLGNDAALTSARLAAGRLDPEAELVCVCFHPEVVRSEHGIKAVPIHMSGPLPDTPSGPRALRMVQRPLFELARWISVYRFLRRTDLVIVPGTGILDDFGESPLRMPYHLFRWSLSARLARTEFAFMSVGAGPIRHPVNRFLMKHAVRFSSYRSYRDDISRSYMADIGASAGDTPVMPDLVFGLACPANPTVTADNSTIGLGVMAYQGWANDPVSGEGIFRTYIENMSTIACRILDKGHSIRVLIGETCDERAVHALLESVRQRRSDVHADRLIYEPIDSMHDLLTRIASTDAVIGTRYHNVVGALMLNRPVVSLGYAARFDEVMKSMGLGDYCHHAESIVPEAVLDDLEELLGNWDGFSVGVDTRNQQYRRELEHQFAALIDPTRPVAESFLTLDAVRVP
ncbi:MAG: polysaccharide pyruvyl transferase family protein [Mycobacterium sp.]|uniref:polysaccharide pyruvyl transferase family protein n=1 Tax=Mycobacterium sp. TaxID=1785 RepID=UPI003899C582